MRRPLGEGAVELAALSWLDELGYRLLDGEEIAPDSETGERTSYHDVILSGRLRAALAKLNPDLPQGAIEEIVRRIERSDTPSVIEENRRLHRMLAEGVDVQVPREEGGALRTVKAWLVDCEEPQRNDWLVVRQFKVIENKYNRRADLVVFVNGLPLAVVELKNPGGPNASLDGAFNQLQTYKAEIPSLFRSNAFLVISDGIQARIGSLTADVERFMPWRTTDGYDLAPKGTPELPVLLKGVFEKRRLLELVRGYTVFVERDGELIKIIAGYHQFHAVRHAVERTLAAAAPKGNRRIGVIWHTQGSGKSLLMAFYAGRIIVEPAMTNPTILVVTDRNDLDDQLLGTFAMCRDLIRQTPVQAESRGHLRELLAVPSGGVVFTTIQKFVPDDGEESYPLLTERRNVVVIADEAHRSQYGLGARINRDSGQVAYGFAKYLRDALPNASFIGFTGTPIESDDRSTPAVFGEYIDIYDIHRAVEDGSTVPIYYESRLAKIELDENERPMLDAEIEDLGEGDEPEEQEKLKQRWSRIEALVGAEKRLHLIAEDLVSHFERRLDGLEGKGMIVCMSRRICVALYNEIVRLRPEWHSVDDRQGAIKIVMTGSASDPLEWQQHIGGKARREQMAKRARDPSDPLRLVMVRDMWLTGFDAPCMHTMYVDKPMRGHGLMQAIARVNRVFRDKPGGLVVDYIGIAHNLKTALREYSDGDRRQAGIDEAEAVALMLEKYEVVRAMFHGFDYSRALAGAPRERLLALGDAMEWILELQARDAARAAGEEAKRQARHRYDDAVLVLSKAYALAAASKAASQIREEVGFFQTVRVALSKGSARIGKRKAEQDAAIQQIVSRAVVSTEIVDVLKAGGIGTTDISVLSDQFLVELQGMERKNLALEALRRLINDEIRAPSRKNVVEQRSFTERLEDAIRRYHNNAITAVQVIEELIQLARDIREARQRGQDEGLSDEELAFYDALAENGSALELMGDEKLRVIAQELLNQLRSNVTVDWTERQSARAKLRVLVRRTLRRYGYPPDLQEAAIRTVIEQAERLAEELADSQLSH